MNENFRVTHHRRGVALPARREGAEARAVYDQNISLTTAGLEHVICTIKQPHGMADTREAHKQAEEWNRVARGLEGWCLSVCPTRVCDDRNIPLRCRGYHPLNCSDHLGL